MESKVTVLKEIWLPEEKVDAEFAVGYSSG